MTYSEMFNSAVYRQDTVDIAYRMAGDGPPLLLLHGFPQTNFMWHKIAPALATDFTVISADLRGYGDSSKPPTDTDHSPYSKRAMAADMVALMTSLGHASFAVAGHDRGGRVAHRMAAITRTRLAGWLFWTSHQQHQCMARLTCVLRRPIIIGFF